MAQCTECHSSYSEGALFCSNCGALTKASNPISYSSSVLLAVALLGLILFWKAASVTSSSSTTVATPVMDEAALLIAKCGKPDIDSAAKPGFDPAHRMLIYRREKVKAVFFGSDKKWHREDMVDAKTQKSLAPEVLRRRLPCAEF